MNTTIKTIENVIAGRKELTLAKNSLTMMHAFNKTIN